MSALEKNGISLTYYNTNFSLFFFPIFSGRERCIETYFVVVYSDNYERSFNTSVSSRENWKNNRLKFKHKSLVIYIDGFKRGYMGLEVKYMGSDRI